MSIKKPIDFVDLRHGLNLILSDPISRTNAIEIFLQDTSKISGSRMESIRRVLTKTMLFGDDIPASIIDEFNDLAIEYASVAIDVYKKDIGSHGSMGGRPKVYSNIKLQSMMDELLSKNPHLTKSGAAEKIARDLGGISAKTILNRTKIKKP